MSKLDMEGGSESNAFSPSPPGTLRRMYRGALWTAVQSWGHQFITLLVFLVLARVLEAEAFGLVAMAAVFVQISLVLVDQGLAAAVIQRAELDDEHVSTAFWLNLMTGLALFAIGVILSGAVASFYEEPRLQPIVAVLSANFLLSSFSGVQDALLRRAFRFKELAVRTLLASTVGGVVGIGMALRDAGPMSLVAQQVVANASGAVLLWSLSDWRPSFRFSVKKARELGLFGANIVGMRLIGVANRRSSDLLIGYFLGAVALGYFTIAFKIFSLLVDVFSKVISRAALPAFAALQNHSRELTDAFGGAFKVSTFLALPSFVSVGILAGDLIPGLFGAQWLQAVPVTRILVVVGLLQGFYVLSHQVMIARGRPSWPLRIHVLNFALATSGFLLVWRHGLSAVALVYSATASIMLPVYVSLLKRLVGIGYREILAYLRIPVVSSCVMIITILVVRSLLPDLMSSFSKSVLLLVAAAVSYLACAFRMDSSMANVIRGLVSKRRKTITATGAG